MGGLLADFREVADLDLLAVGDTGGADQALPGRPAGRPGR